MNPEISRIRVAVVTLFNNQLMGRVTLEFLFPGIDCRIVHNILHETLLQIYSYDDRWNAVHGLTDDDIAVWIAKHRLGIA